MAECWKGLFAVGDDIIYQGTQGKLIELSSRDKSRGVMQTPDGREYLVVVEYCENISKKVVEERCPRCVYEGKPGELFENATLKRCYECSSDYKFELKEGAIQEPVRGMKAILG